MIVFDSSAMLAYLQSEAGGDLVRDVLTDPDRDVPVYAHAVNLCEVFYAFLRIGGAALAEEVMADLKADGVEERNDMDATFWRDVAGIIATQRTAGEHLALGDAFGLALARREGADFYTADRHELEAVAKAGLCAIIFIR